MTSVCPMMSIGVFGFTRLMSNMNGSTFKVTSILWVKYLNKSKTQTDWIIEIRSWEATKTSIFCEYSTLLNVFLIILYWGFNLFTAVNDLLLRRQSTVMLSVSYFALVFSEIKMLPYLFLKATSVKFFYFSSGFTLIVHKINRNPLETSVVTK